MSPRRPAVLRDGGDQTLRELLVSVAARLIALHGTVGLTVRGIATEAGVAQGVLYNHFHDREELVALALHSYTQDVMHNVDLPAAGTATVEENLRAYLTFGLSTIGRLLPAFGGVIGQPKILARFVDHSHDDLMGRIPDLFGNYLRAEQELGRISADADVDATAFLIVGACHSEALPRLIQGVPDSSPVIRPEFVEALIRTVMLGIAPR
jgi:AcrR family transcriptional regulator